MPELTIAINNISHSPVLWQIMGTVIIKVDGLLAGWT
jgi:hypothetical protein